MAARKKTTAPTPTPAVDPIAGMIDELGELEKWAASGPAAKLSRIDTLRKALRETVDAKGVAYASVYTLSGAKYLAIFGAKGDASTVDKAALAASIGTDKFISIAKVTLESLKQFPGLAAQVVLTAFNVGPRPLTISERQ